MKKQKTITLRKRSGLLIAITVVTGVLVASTAVFAFATTGFSFYNIALIALALAGEAFLIYRSATGLKVKVPVDEGNNPIESIPPTPSKQVKNVESKNLVLNG